MLPVDRSVVGGGWVNDLGQATFLDACLLSLA